MPVLKKNRAIVFGLTKNYTFAIACVLLDIKRICQNAVDEIVIYHDGISEKDISLLLNILPIRFIYYHFPITDKAILSAPSIQQFTRMVFTKFECLALLEEYRAVLWLDYDIVIQRDISGLFSKSTSDLKMMSGGISVRGQLLKSIPEYNMDAEGVAAGTFVFFDSLPNYKNLHKFCYQKLEEYAQYLYMPDQAIFDFMIQEFDLKPDPIDVAIYSPHPTDPKNAESAIIIHAYGQPKFWNGLENENWKKNYRYWLSIGGSKFSPVSFQKKALKKIKSILNRICVF